MPQPYQLLRFLSDFRYFVDLQAESGRKMSYDMARQILKYAIELEKMGRKQAHLVALGDNNLRNYEEEPQDLLKMFEFLMRRARIFKGKINNTSTTLGIQISLQGTFLSSRYVFLPIFSYLAP